MQGSAALGFQMGTAQGIYPWVGTLVMGNLMGRRVWVGRGCFFLGGGGGEEKASGHGQQGRSLDDVCFQTAPFCYILYVEQWGFRCSMSSGHHEGGPRSWGELRKHRTTASCWAGRECSSLRASYTTSLAALGEGHLDSLPSPGLKPGGKGVGGSGGGGGRKRVVSWGELSKHRTTASCWAGRECSSLRASYTTSLEPHTEILA